MSKLKVSILTGFAVFTLAGSSIAATTKGTYMRAPGSAIAAASSDWTAAALKPALAFKAHRVRAREAPPALATASKTIVAVRPAKHLA